MKHELKIWPQFYEAVKDGSKTFEVRENDRAFQRGETVVLKEWDPTEVDYNNYPMGGDWGPQGYTHRELEFKIGYVLPIDDKRVVFSLLKDSK